MIGWIRIHSSRIVKLKETKRVFLTKEELTALEEKEINIERLSNVRDVFIFCCYTCLSYVDVEKLTPSRQRPRTTAIKASAGCASFIITQGFACVTLRYWQ